MFSRCARSLSLAGFIAFCGFLLIAACLPLNAHRPPLQDFPSVPVLISDFELFSSATTLPPSHSTGASDAPKKPTGGNAAVFDSSDAPGIQARRLMDFFATTLVQEFQKNGFNAARQQGSSRPDKGILLRGVFAEPDAHNRIRRAMFGAGSPGVRMTLYVGTFNLARPDQPLYQPAAMQSPDSHYGPVITMNNYIPMTKFEIFKNPTEDEVQKISAQIVQNVTTLLRTNAAAFSQ